MSWEAFLTNDPARDFDLYVELLENDEFMGRIQRDSGGLLELVIYDEKKLRIPLDWLLEVSTVPLT